MKEIKFKTNINCSNCIRAVSGFLDEVENLKNWEVDTGHSDKILKVQGDAIDPELVVEAVEDAGFDIELIE